MSEQTAQQPGRTGRQAVWNYVVFVASKSSTLIMTVVLARLLTPADFGLFALALAVITLFDYVKDLGVGAALVQNRTSWAKLAPTGLTLTLAFGVAFGGVVLIAADVIAAALDHPALAPLLRVLAACLAISAIGGFPAAALRRRLDFRARLVPEFLGAAVKTVLTIALAWGGLGVWSLAWGQLAAVTVTTILYWQRARVSPQLGYDRDIAKALLRFGAPASALSLIAFAIYNIDYLVIGIRLTDADLGLYTLAYRLPQLLVLALCAVVGEVLFSALSQLQEDLPALTDQYVRVVLVVMALTAPIGLAMAATAPAIVDVMYGADYAGSAAPLALLSIYTVLYSMGFHTGDVYKAIGRPGLLTAINAAKLLLLIGPIWFAAGHGIVWVAAALLAVEVVHVAIRILVVRRIIGVSLVRLMHATVPPLAAAAVAAVAIWQLTALIDNWASIVQLLALTPVFLAIYVCGLKIVSPKLVRDTLNLVRKDNDEVAMSAGGSQ